MSKDLTSQKKNLVGIISGEAREVMPTGEIGVWTDGIGLYYDRGPMAEFKLKPGKHYIITIEEIENDTELL